MKTKDLRKDWLNFCISFLLIAQAGTKSILDPERTDEERQRAIQTLYIAILFNTKHAIEAFVKSLIVMIGDDGQLEKNQWHHSSLKSFEYLETLLKNKKIQKLLEEEAKSHTGDPAYDFVNGKVGEFPSLLKDFSALITKYHFCSFLKDKIQTNYSVEDIQNDAFRYPQNHLSITLDYEALCSRVTKKDIRELDNDIQKLNDLLIYFALLFFAYIESGGSLVEV